MSSARTPKNSASESSVVAIFKCLGACLATAAAADEERQARDAHNRHDHRDEQRHYNNAANLYHNAGNHYAELNASDNAHEAGHEARNEAACLVM